MEQIMKRGHARIETKRKHLTIVDMPMQRVCRACDNVRLHYRVKELGDKWLCTRTVSGLRRRGIEVSFGRPA
jgi:hypothetical protein